MHQPPMVIKRSWTRQSVAGLGSWTRQSSAGQAHATRSTDLKPWRLQLRGCSWTARVQPIGCQCHGANLKPWRLQLRTFASPDRIY